MQLNSLAPRPDEKQLAETNCPFGQMESHQVYFVCEHVRLSFLVCASVGNKDAVVGRNAGPENSPTLKVPLQTRSSVQFQNSSKIFLSI